ncbi:MAG TPA: hypothetical protein VK689_08070 [Armatimonadota bacterium]|nr:hypothetical protein [Armatimonadota bacterium]
MRVRLERPYYKPVRGAHLICAVTLLYLVLLFVFPGQALLARALRGEPAAPARLAWGEGLPETNPRFIGAMVGIYLLMLVAALATGVFGKRTRSAPAGAGSATPTSPMADGAAIRRLKEATDSVGLGWLNGLLVGVAGLGLLIAWTTGTLTTSLGFLAGAVALLALAGAEYGAAGLVKEKRVTPADLDEITLPLHPTARVEGVFEWLFRPLTPGEEGGVVTLRFPFTLAEPRYHRAVALPRPRPEAAEYGAFLSRETNPELAALAARIEESRATTALPRTGFPTTALEAPWNVLSFVQQFRLVLDLDRRGRKGYVRTPTEVLWEREGTPDCLVLLAAALLRTLDYPHALVWIEPVAGSGRVLLALPGFDYLGKAGEFYFDPAAGRYCALCEPVPKGGPGAATAPAKEWGWSVGPIPEADRGLPLRRIA